MTENKHSFDLPAPNAAVHRRDPLLDINPAPSAGFSGSSSSSSSSSSKKDKTKMKPWQAMLETYMESGHGVGLARRCMDCELTPSDINALMESLEMSGEDMTTLDVFAASLRLTEPEINALVRTYSDSLGRSLQIARAKRKEFIMDGAMSQVFRNSSSIKQLTDNPKLMDMFQVEDEKLSNASVATKAESLLQERGVKPGGYSQAVFLTGDINLDEDAGFDRELEEKFSVVRPEEILRAFMDVDNNKRKEVAYNHGNVDGTDKRVDEGEDSQGGGDRLRLREKITFSF